MQRDHSITTPQNVEFAFKLAGVPSRGLAWLIDSCVMLLAVILALTLAFTLWGAVSWSLASAVSVLLFFAINFGYMLFFELRWNGQTPGKRLLGLRAIRDDGTAIDFRASLVRNLLRFIDGFPQVGTLNTMLLGSAVAGQGRRGKRLGDWAAETVVVHVARTRIPRGFKATRGADNSLREQPRLVDRIRRTITLAERELLIDLCVRSDELELEHRTRLFADTAAYLCELLDFELPEHMSGEKLVQNVADILLDA